MALLAIAAGAGVAYLFLNYPAVPPPESVTVQATPEMVARGDGHTPTDGQGQPISGRDFAGGFEFPLRGGAVVRSANITPDATTGIGAWTEQQFIDKFKAFDGLSRRTLSAADHRENTTMPWYEYAGIRGRIWEPSSRICDR